MFNRLIAPAVVWFALSVAPRIEAQAPAPTDTAAVTPAGMSRLRGLRTRTELEGFMDGLLTGLLNEKHVAGATVSVVKDGKLYFAKGYGYADFDKRLPVDPTKTMFRIGSISKLFTWTSVMQLVEQGKLDLNKDINEYLDWKIPATYPEPITLTHVLTHTPGFEEDGRDLFTDDPAHVAVMGEWLKAHMPKRVRPPGTFSSYSNWATGAAGYIVERQSGLTWDQYIKKNIIDPLGMTHTTGAQPLPAEFSADMSNGYSWDQGRFESKKYEIVTGDPAAGSVAASATDMARFMIAHLNDGAYGDVRILGDSTAKLMHARLQGHDDRIPGFAHGFYEQSSHGLRIFGHGGDTQWFHSDLALIPSEKLGVFVSFNTNTGGAISFEPFLVAFLDHYYPEELTAITPSAGAKAGAQRYVGQYLFNRMNFTTFQKALSLAQVTSISAADDGALVVTGLGSAPSRFVAIDSMLFRDVTTGTKLAFRADDRGNITHGFLSSIPMMALDRQSGTAGPKLHRVILGAGLVMFLGILIAAGQRYFRRRVGNEVAAPPSIASGRRVMVAVAIIALASVALLGLSASNPTALMLGNPPASLKISMVLPILAALLTLLGLWYGITQWRKGEGRIPTRLRHLGAVLVALLFFWSLNSWNLLGWRF